jgi:hypothetical protein
MARRSKAAPLATTDEGLVRVYPSPALLARAELDGTFLPGVGPDGADIPPALAAEWLEAGLATTEAPAPPAEE